MVRKTMVGLLSALASALPVGAAAYEEPAYEVVETHEAFELRRYAPKLVAETTVRGEFDDVGNVAFRRLAGFIFGSNRAKQDIAMTAPVSQTPARVGEKIAMTTPVGQTPDASEPGAWRFTFVMPATFTLETLPEPTDERVRIREVPGKLVAARRYSGGWSEARYRENEAGLLEAVRGAGLRLGGEPIFARYNSPFSLWFLRRNEVLVDVARER